MYEDEVSLEIEQTENFRNNLVKFFSDNTQKLRQRFFEQIDLCGEPEACFKDCLQETIVDLLNNPKNWDSLTDEHKFNRTAQYIKYKAYKIFAKCGECNLKRFCLAEESITETQQKNNVVIKSPYEDDFLTNVCSSVAKADPRNILTSEEINILILSYELGFSSKEIAEILNSEPSNVRNLSPSNVRKIKERAIGKLRRLNKKN